MITPEKIKEILKEYCINLRFHARGGQGGVTASNLSVEAFSGYGISQPKFGAERAGSPTESYVRLSFNKDLIRSNEQVYAPHLVSVLDDSLLKEIDVSAGMPQGGWLIVNSIMEESEIQNIIKRKDINIARIDASSIALEILGRNISNTIILGALVRVSHLFTLEELSEAIRKRFKGEIVEKNIIAVKHAIEATCLYESDVELDLTSDTKVLWQQVEPEKPGFQELDKAGVWYCDEDIITYGSSQVNTGSWSELEMLWDKEICIDCGRCWFICPDFSILREKDDEGLWHMAGIDQFHCKSCLNCMNICPVKAISSKAKIHLISC